MLKIDSKNEAPKKKQMEIFLSRKRSPNKCGCASVELFLSTTGLRPSGQPGNRVRSTGKILIGPGVDKQIGTDTLTQSEISGGTQAHAYVLFNGRCDCDFRN